MPTERGLRSGPGVAELAEDFRSGRRTPTEACEAALRRAGEPAARSAFLTVCQERAMAAAEGSTQRWRTGRPRGPLDGVPVAWKDLIDIAGTVTTAGSAAREGLPPSSRDATVVKHLEAAGMVSIGKTNLSELAYSGLGVNRHFGTPVNPRDARRVPGGSSSGSAVAVASRVVPCAIGTDTSGSIRIPASFCGLVGLRPSGSQVDRTGVMALSPTLDSVGPITSTVADARLLFAALKGDPQPSPSRETATAAAIGVVVPAGELTEDVEPAVARGFGAAVELLAAAGVRIERRPLDPLARALEAMDELGSIVGAEAAIQHSDLIDSPAAKRLDPRVLHRLDVGRIDDSAYRSLLRLRERLQAELTAELEGRLVAYPTVRHAAPSLLAVEDDDAYFELNATTLRSTMVASYLDLPGASLPCAKDEEGQPVGLLLSAPPNHDTALLEGATVVERLL